MPEDIWGVDFSKFRMTNSSAKVNGVPVEGVEIHIVSILHSHVTGGNQCVF